MSMLQIFISVLAAIEVDRLIWSNIRRKSNPFNNACVREIKLPLGASQEDIIEAIRKDLERMKNDDKHQ